MRAMVRPLRNLLLEHDSTRERSRQKTPGPSTVGACVRQASYMAHGVEPSDEIEGHVAAALATYIHAGVLAALEAVAGAMIEVKVGDPAFSGSLDALYLTGQWLKKIKPARYRPTVSEDVNTVEDIKTTYSGQSVAEYRRRGPNPAHVHQVLTYAYLISTFGVMVDEKRPKVGLQRALSRVGPIPIQKVRIRYLGRDLGEEYVWEQPVTDFDLFTAQMRLEQALEEAPESIARELLGPGLSKACDYCPFKTRCWGPQDAPQAALLHEGMVEVEEVLADYLQAADEEKAARERKLFARNILTGAQTGTYGAYQLRWSNPIPPKEVPDAEAMAQYFEDNHLPVPTKTRAGRSGSITVRNL